MTTNDPKPPKSTDLRPAPGGIGSTDPALGVQGPTALPSSPPLTFVACLFLLLVFGVPIAQAVYEKARGKGVQALEYFEPFGRGLDGRPASAWAKQLALDLASEPRLRRFELELHDASFVKHELLPWYQLGIAALFRHGTRKAVLGRDDWLFFGDDLASAYGRGYLEPGLGGQEALEAIDDFKRQLDARKIQLLLIPSYSKEMLDPSHLSRFTADLRSAVNPDLEKLYAELQRRKLEFVRMDEIFAQRLLELAASRPSTPLALPQDTHWTPETMEFAARRIAERARQMLGDTENDESPLFTTKKTPIEGHGDLVRMLGLPPGQTLYPPMQLELEQVVERATNELARSDATADVLLMGDSLTKVFSEPSLGLGEGAGLGEHLMLHLNRPLDVIALPGGSATATREALKRRPDGLAGKKLVIWQFGVRMLASGPKEWRKVDLTPRAPNEFGAPGPRDVSRVKLDEVTIVGEIVEVSKTPPEFGYPFVLLIYEYKVLEVLDGKVDGDRVWVAYPAIVKGEDQPARRFTPGMRHRLRLDDVRLHYDFEQVPYFDDTEAPPGAVIHSPLEWEPVR